MSRPHLDPNEPQQAGGKRTGVFAAAPLSFSLSSSLRPPQIPHVACVDIYFLSPWHTGTSCAFITSSWARFAWALIIFLSVLCGKISTWPTPLSHCDSLSHEVFSMQGFNVLMKRYTPPLHNQDTEDHNIAVRLPGSPHFQVVCILLFGQTSFFLLEITVIQSIWRGINT